MKSLPKTFYTQDTLQVALNLLNKVLVRKLGKRLLKGKIVEVEAYFGVDDPASRAYGGKKTKINSTMWAEPGTILVYMVHNNWLLNFVTEKKGKPAAVLIRALEPIEGVEQMFKNRKLKNHNIGKVEELCSGPGKLTQALKIDKSLNGKPAGRRTGLWVEDRVKQSFASPRKAKLFKEGGKENFYIASSKRIGVKRDLPRNLRFYIKGNKFVSKAKVS